MPKGTEALAHFLQYFQTLTHTRVAMFLVSWVTVRMLTKRPLTDKPQIEKTFHRPYLWAIRRADYLKRVSIERNTSGVRIRTPCFAGERTCR